MVGTSRVARRRMKEETIGISVRDAAAAAGVSHYGSFLQDQEWALAEGTGSTQTTGNDGVRREPLTVYGAGPAGSQWQWSQCRCHPASACWSCH